MKKNKSNKNNIIIGLITYLIISLFNFAYRYTIMNEGLISSSLRENIGFFSYYKPALIPSFIWFYNPVIFIIDIILAIGIFYLIKRLKEIW